VVAPSRFDDGAADEFFAGRSTSRGSTRGYWRAAALVKAIRRPPTTGELAAEDQVVAAFLDASGSLWSKSHHDPAATHVFMASLSRIWRRNGRHTRQSTEEGCPECP